MQSQTKLSPVVGRDGIQGGRNGRRQEAEMATVELDTTLAANLGLLEGMKVWFDALNSPKPIASHQLQ